MWGSSRDIWDPNNVKFSGGIILYSFMLSQVSLPECR